MVKDVQEKLIIAFIPVSVILLFASHALVTLWIGANVDIITTTLLVITIGSLLGNLALEPIHIYLGVYRPLRLFYNQIFGIVAITFPMVFIRNVLGFETVFIAFALSYVVSFVHMLYCQKYFLRDVIFNSFKKVLNLIGYLLVLLLVGYLLSSIGLTPELTLLVIPVVITLLAFYLVREFRFVLKKDVNFYLDEKLDITKKLARLFK